MNNHKSLIDLTELHDQGLIALADQHKEGEAAKLGTLRGGNSGCVTDAGKLLGKCPRLSHMRSLGYQKDVELNKHLMFAAGMTNEDSWLDTLKAVWQGPIRCEEEIPIHWQTTNGTSVTGRPDIVLCEDTPTAGGRITEVTPVLGLELKLVCSPFTAYNVMAKQLPTMDHAIQAAHYMWQLEVPFKLVYTSRMNFALGFGSMKKTWDTVPAHYFNDSGTSIEPFVKVYDLWFDNGVLVYDTDRISKPVHTDITIEGIEKYYECTSRIAETGSLGPRPQGGAIDGAKLSWHPCDKCPLQETCDSYDHDYETWLDFAKKDLT